MAALAQHIDAAHVQQHLAEVGRRVGNVQDWLLVWGQRIARQARENARAKGGRRFWSEVARSVQVQSVSTSAVVVGSRHVAAAQKQYGGTINPVGAKALTIPISDEAKGRRASEFEAGGRELFVLDLGRDTDTVGILGYAERDGSFHALYVLRSRVVQQAEPWWPTYGEMQSFGIEEATRFAQEVTR